MTLEEAVNLVLYAFESGINGDTLVQKSKSVSMKIFIDAFKIALNIPDYSVEKIGIRHGEKKYEALLGEEELLRAVELEKFYRVPIDSRGLNYEQYMEEGIAGLAEINESYNSNNAERMDLQDLVDLFKQELTIT
jgi:UDP-glucose 4-epimerase